jgi:hypothetical protein
MYRICSNEQSPTSPYKAEKNEKCELIAFLINNFFKKDDRKMSALGRSIEQILFTILCVHTFNGSWLRDLCWHWWR